MGSDDRTDGPDPGSPRASATSGDDPARRAAQYRVDREIERERAEAGLPPRTAEEAAADRADGRRVPMSERARFADTAIDQAIRRGEFDDLPLQGKPLPGIGGSHDPDWWLKNLVQRDRITGVLPAAQLRQEDAVLEETLDREGDENRVRQVLEDFNARVVDARRQLRGGPPVVTPTRDVEQEVARWRARRRR
ncbi:DUF1992 domain-containing protein [Isoptericola sp. b408]|uniref:DnaJ family domain-containing protein n=1 Tax=Isoptericola sp. b408 TaxID=3064653 RepID=UPI0027122CBB|nr:DUF1992 domain-containing protein [Isoptericola sp. b408]MDO8150092.1 DUF1992 domain-containing protein [Isoptericola sp. b408]